MNKEQLKQYHRDYYNKYRRKRLRDDFILKDYDKYHYWEFIKEQKPLGRLINEKKLFNESDLEYITNLN